MAVSESRAKKTPAASSSRSSGRAPAARSKAKATPPRGRDEVVEAIISATLSLWVARGPESVSLRAIAARAGVNYGLVHRHFGTKDAVIKAALNRAVERSLELLEPVDDIYAAIDVMLSAETGGFARLLAWAILQGEPEDLFLDEYPVLDRLRELVAKESGLSKDARETRVLVGSIMVSMFGWRLFEPYLHRGLGLDLSRSEGDRLLKDVIASTISKRRR